MINPQICFASNVFPNVSEILLIEVQHQCFRHIIVSYSDYKNFKGIFSLFQISLLVQGRNLNMI